MKTFKKITVGLIGIALGSISGGHAQQASLYTHYMYNTLVVNPAYAGSREALTITALHRSQWVGFDGAPRTQTLTAHTPLGNKHVGVGLSLLNDKIGPTNNTSIIGNFAYRMEVSEKSKLALGLSAGANVVQGNLSTLEIEQQADPAFQNDIKNHITPNFGFGAYYSRERFYTGVSVPSIVQNKYSAQNLSNGIISEAKEQRHYFFIAGAYLKISENLAFKPTTLVKVTAGAPIQADFTGSFEIAKRLLVGAMFRTGDAVGGLVGFDILEQLRLGYSYDWSYGLKTPKYNQGSHEIMLRYDFISFSKKQIHSPRHF